jgi:hypothetical protein
VVNAALSKVENHVFTNENHRKSNHPCVLELNQKKGSLIEESLEVLRDKTLAIDADIMLKKVKANPKKSLQDGHCALDMSVQLGIMKIIETFR